MADLIYNNALDLIANGEIDFSDDTFKVMLVTSSYSPDIDADENRDDVDNEVTGEGYTEGGAEVNITATQDNDTDTAIVDSADITWSAATITDAAAAILYKVVGTAGTDLLIAYFDFGGNKSSSGADFKLIIDAAGWFTVAKGT